MQFLCFKEYTEELYIYKNNADDRNVLLNYVKELLSVYWTIDQLDKK